MKQTHQFRVAGVGTAIGAVMIGSLWLACQPGTLPCDNPTPEWKDVCALPDDPPPPSGTGGVSGMSGGGGGGAGMSGTPMPPTKDTPIPGCAKYPTLGKMDEFFATRCGSDGACHTTPGAAVWKDLKMPDIWDRMRTVKSSVDCGGAAMIDTTAWDKSLLWVITRSPKAPCPNGGMIIRLMPPQEPANVMPKEALLSADENTCLEGFLKVLAGK